MQNGIFFLVFCLFMLLLLFAGVPGGVILCHGERGEKIEMALLQLPLGEH